MFLHILIVFFIILLVWQLLAFSKSYFFPNVLVEGMTDDTNTSTSTNTDSTDPQPQVSGTCSGDPLVLAKTNAADIITLQKRIDELSGQINEIVANQQSQATEMVGGDTNPEITGTEGEGEEEENSPV
jgi:hypothetical protein